MPRRPEGRIPLVRLDASLRAPLQRQLADAIRAMVREGDLDPGARLPSTRSLAEDLEVSRSTVVAAFERLVAEGWLESRAGSGTRVARGIEGIVGDSDEHARPPTADPPPPPPDPRPFEPGVPAVDEFSAGPFARALRRVLRSTEPGRLTIGPLQGDPALRRQIAAHLRATRGVDCGPDEILVTSGAQEGLTLAFASVARAGETVWMEDPGYIGARRALEALGVTPLPVPVDGDGMRVESVLPAGEGGERTGRADGSECPPPRPAAAAYVTPSHQFPTGSVLPLHRRLALLDWAEETGGWIVEDDYDSEFRLEGRPLPAMQGLTADARVVYVGTFSKSLAPGLRLGFLVVPDALRARVLERKRAGWGPAPRWTQAALADFIRDGHFARHIRRTRVLYRERRDALRAAVRDHWGAGPPRLREPTGAMHAVLELPGCDVARVVRGAAERGVRLLALDFFRIPPAAGSTEAAANAALEPGVVLGFAGYTPDRIRRAVGEVAATLRGD